MTTKKHTNGEDFLLGVLQGVSDVLYMLHARCEQMSWEDVRDFAESNVRTIQDVQFHFDKLNTENFSLASFQTILSSRHDKGLN